MTQALNNLIVLTGTGVSEKVFVTAVLDHTVLSFPHMVVQLSL